jgi:hypothetical protein
MLPNAFINKPEVPTDKELAEALGPAKAAWDELIAGLAAEDDVAVQEWKSYSLKTGWALRLKRKKRTIVYLSPCQGCFRVAFILGDRAMQAARQSRLPRRAIALLDEAPRYPEGTGVRLDVRGLKDIAVVRQLAKVKLEN